MVGPVVGLGSHTPPSINPGGLATLKASFMGAATTAVLDKTAKYMDKKFGALDGDALYDAMKADKNLFGKNNHDEVFARLDADAQMRAGFIHAADNNPTFLTVMDAAKLQNPDAILELVRNDGTKTAGVLTYIGNNPSLDMMKLAEAVKGVDFAGKPKDAIIALKSGMEKNGIGEHAGGIIASMAASNGASDNVAEMVGKVATHYSTTDWGTNVIASVAAEIAANGVTKPDEVTRRLGDTMNAEMATLIGDSSGDALFEKLRGTPGLVGDADAQKKFFDYLAKPENESTRLALMDSIKNNPSMLTALSLDAARADAGQMGMFGRLITTDPKQLFDEIRKQGAANGVNSEIVDKLLGNLRMDESEAALLLRKNQLIGILGEHDMVDVAVDQARNSKMSITQLILFPPEADDPNLSDTTKRLSRRLHKFGTDIVMEDFAKIFKDLDKNYHQIFDNIRELINGLDPRWQAIINPILALIEPIIPMALKGFGLIANLGMGLGTELHKVSTMTGDPLGAEADGSMKLTQGQRAAAVQEKIAGALPSTLSDDTLFDLERADGTKDRVGLMDFSNQSTEGLAQTLGITPNADGTLPKFYVQRIEDVDSELGGEQPGVKVSLTPFKESVVRMDEETRASLDKMITGLKDNYKSTFGEELDGNTEIAYMDKETGQFKIASLNELSKAMSVDEVKETLGMTGNFNTAAAGASVSFEERDLDNNPATPKVRTALVAAM